MNAQIQEVYKTSKSYPELISKLVAIGIQSYTVDVATSTILYRLAEGRNVLHPNDMAPRNINLKFNREETITAIRTNQQGKSDYPTFMNEIAMAGVRFYEATLSGDKKCVTYIGCLFSPKCTSDSHPKCTTPNGIILDFDSEK